MNADVLQAWLSERARRAVRVVITENRSLMLSFKAQPDGTLVVRAHRMFLDAPDQVKQALADWIARRRGQHRAVIRQFIRSRESQRQLELPLASRAPRRLHLRPCGRVYDLREIRDQVNREYFGERLRCGITWGRRPQGRARRHFTFGTYSHAQNVVRVHPRLDAADVPRFFVEFIVYHEMLHAARGQEGERNGRRIIHSKVFRADERKFAQYREAIEWEKKNLHRFLAW